MPTNIVDIGQWRLTRRDRFRVASRDECPHHHIVLDDRGEVIVCEDCQAQLSAYWVLSNLTDDILHERARNEAGRQRLLEQAQAALHLTGARRLESLWQQGRLVPTCPHCSAGILAEDDLGQRTMPRSAELRRRRSARAHSEDEGPPPV